MGNRNYKSRNLQGWNCGGIENIGFRLAREAESCYRISGVIFCFHTRMLGAAVRVTVACALGYESQTTRATLWRTPNDCQRV
jgi:hypothetical protein